jgi:hypothetical protein
VKPEARSLVQSLVFRFKVCGAEIEVFSGGEGIKCAKIRAIFHLWYCWGSAKLPAPMIFPFAAAKIVVVLVFTQAKNYR